MRNVIKETCFQFWNFMKVMKLQSLLILTEHPIFGEYFLVIARKNTTENYQRSVFFLIVEFLTWRNFKSSKEKNLSQASMFDQRAF